MRTVIAVTLALAGCNQRSTPEEVETGAFDPSAAVQDSADTVRVDVHRRDVPLEAMPIVAATLGGLPMSGLADVAIDLAVPVQGGARRYRESSGSIAVSCAAGCVLGDDRAKLTVRGQALEFGKVAIDKLDARVDIGDGRVELTRWDVASKDLALNARLRIDLADTFDASVIDGCVWFRPAADLARRDPKTAAVLATTGAIADADGFFQIRISGTVGARKYLSQACRPGQGASPLQAASPAP